MKEQNRLAGKPTSQMQAEAAAANIREQTPEEKARTDAQVLEGKLRAFGSLEAHDRHQVLAQTQLPRMLVHIGLLKPEDLAEAQAEVARWVNEQ